MHTLGQEIHADRALEELGVGSDAPRFFDGAFVVTPDAVLCFFTLGSARVESSRRVVWKQPDHGGQSPVGGAPHVAGVRARLAEKWPSLVVDVYDRSVRPPARIRQHRLFLRRSEHDPSVYVGPAHLASYGMDGTATFELDEPLARPLWLRLGGYSGFNVELAHKSIVVADDDVLAFEAKLTELSRTDDAHLVVTRYEDDSLHVFTNRSRAFIMYLRDPADSGLYLEPGPNEFSDADETFHCDCGIALVYPARRTVSRDEAMAIARAFFRTRALPKDRRWTDDVP